MPAPKVSWGRSAGSRVMSNRSGSAATPSSKFAVASDGETVDAELPHFDLDDVVAIADFLVARFELKSSRDPV